ncbi:putative nucleotidyltransferase [Catalinimonas alkaloidigena]|uniref:lantibiotic dehydratase C-terminal domain-containing protein n=1 Tax=Catalinimonas alkaloidigena TaxID=1075417 RepID=UPI0024073F29|nr:lantibiotic dehydratase C-terminal domain-containing protein [Catalinimonas alkaloidigena]MDF9799372.1 putative nucleotidyltransferase [Catalinimonas alkaloidigena]
MYQTKNIDQIALNATNSRFPDSDGLLICGSAVNGSFNERSDIDLLIFYDRIQSSYREVFTYAGYEIEAMVYPTHTFLNEIVAEGEKRKNALKELCLKSKILKDTEGHLARIRCEVKKIYQAGPAPLSDSELQKQRYVITNRLDDFMTSESFAISCFILNDLLTNLLDFILITHGKWPYKGSGKWQIKALQQYDEDIYHTLISAMEGFYQQADKEAIATLVHEQLSYSGGRLKSGFKNGVPPELNQSRKWFSIEIYYASDQNRLITEAVPPFVQFLRQKNWVERCFFNRYTENGPHLSLFLITEEETFDTLIKPFANQCFEAYFKKAPSVRVTPAWVADLPKEQQWFPDNSLQYQRKEILPALFGGNAATKLMEDLFDFSSSRIGRLIQQDSGWSERKAMGAALKLALLSFHALAIDTDKLKVSAWFQLQELIPYACGATVNAQTGKNFIEKMEANYQHTAPNTKATIQSIWQKLQEHEFTGELESEWHHKMNGFTQNISALNQQEQLLLSEVSPNWHIEMDKFTQYSFMNYKHITHMLNNQLGLRYADECYLFYIIHQCANTIST